MYHPQLELSSARPLPLIVDTVSDVNDVMANIIQILLSRIWTGREDFVATDIWHTKKTGDIDKFQPHRFCWLVSKFRTPSNSTRTFRVFPQKDPRILDPQNSWPCVWFFGDKSQNATTTTTKNAPVFEDSPNIFGDLWYILGETGMWSNSKTSFMPETCYESIGLSLRITPSGFQHCCNDDRRCAWIKA